jgi:rubrerythrin
MYSSESLSNIFQGILQFEEKAKKLYDDCIKKLEDKDTINILQSISNEEKGHIELARKLMEIIQEDFLREMRNK